VIIKIKKEGILLALTNIGTFDHPSSGKEAATLYKIERRPTTCTM